MEFLRPDDVDREALALFWHRSWVDGHKDHVPAAFLKYRGMEQFFWRVDQIRNEDAFVAVKSGAIVGFLVVEKDEIAQLFVGEEARGTGLAGELIARGLGIIKSAGFDRAWLCAVVGNERALRFYEKRGFAETGRRDYQAATPDGPFPVPCVYFERTLDDIDV